jgi:Small Multidrug Resistance protein
MSQLPAGNIGLPNRNAHSRHRISIIGPVPGPTQSKAPQVLPPGTAYAVWTGIGATGSIVVGIVIFREPATFVRLFGIAVTRSGIVGLKLASS